MPRTPPGEIKAMIRAIIFDLDGTLVDTLGDIATVMNGWLRSKSWPEHPLEAYRQMVGRGLARLIQAAVPASESAHAETWYDEVFGAYEAMGIGESRPYPGVTETLQQLRDAGLPLAVISNKPDAITRSMVAALFPSIDFALVRGGLVGVPSKPNPVSALAAAQACAVAPCDCAFVGDSDVDMKTALAAGMMAVGAAWGFRGEAELRTAGAMLIISSMTELPSILS